MSESKKIMDPTSPEITKNSISEEIKDEAKKVNI